MLEKWKEILALAAAAEKQVADELPAVEQDYQRALERHNLAQERLKYYRRLRNATAEMTAFLEAEQQRIYTPPSDPANPDMTCTDVAGQEGTS